MPFLQAIGPGSSRGYGQRGSTGGGGLAFTGVTSGLTVHLDAGNPASYPGSGSSWNNLVAGSAAWNMQGSPPFSAADYGGSFSNNGGGNGWSWPVDFGAPDNFTYEIWCRPTDTTPLHGLNTFSTNHRHIIASDNRGDSDCGAGFSVGTNGIMGNEHANSYLSVSSNVSTSISSSVPSHVVFVYSGKTPIMYVNATNVGGSVRTSGRSRVLSSGSRIGYGDYGSYNGYYYIVRYYNRVLDATEIATNFNAQRARFGV